MIITASKADTILSISQKYNIPEAKIISDNGIVGETLVTGQSLIIDIPDEYIFTLFGTTANKISDSTGITTTQLFRNNYFLKGKNNVPENSFVVLSYINTPALTKITGGYAYDFIPLERLSSVINYLTYIMPFTYGFTEDGNLISPNDAYILEIATSSGAKPLMHISTLTSDGYFDSNLPSVLFENPDSVQRLIENIISTIEHKGYFGADVDFEYLPEGEKENYADFLQNLANALHNKGKILIVAVPPKVSDDQRSVLVDGIDYKSLGEIADYILIMAYEYGYKFGPPLAIAPVNQVRGVLDYAITRIVPEKILLGIPNYGYDWTLPYVSGESDAPSISTVEAIELAKRYGAEIQYDNISKAPFFFYTDEESREHEVWFEDARSYAAKVSLIREYGLAGGFIWDLMRENPQGFVTLNSLIDII